MPLDAELLGLSERDYGAYLGKFDADKEKLDGLLQTLADYRVPKAKVIEVIDLVLSGDKASELKIKKILDAQDEPNKEIHDPENKK